MDAIHWHKPSGPEAEAGHGHLYDRTAYLAPWPHIGTTLPRSLPGPGRFGDIATFQPAREFGCCGAIMAMNVGGREWVVNSNGWSTGMTKSKSESSCPASEEVAGNSNTWWYVRFHDGPKQMPSRRWSDPQFAEIADSKSSKCTPISASIAIWKKIPRI